MNRHTPLSTAFRRPWPGTLRGLVLWLFSLSFVALGSINYVATEPPERTQQALTFAFTIAPPVAWGGIMVAAGLASAFSSYCHRGRDRYGYVILATFCGAWGMAYVTGYVLFGADLRSLSGSVVWLAFAGILVCVAGFPNVPLGRLWDDE